MRLRPLAIALFVLVSSPAARADVPPPNSTCGGKKAGEACQTDDKKPGTCADQKCSRLDYSQSPPSSVQYDCLLCVADGAGASSGGTSSGTTSSGASSTGGSSASGGDSSSKSGCATAPGERPGPGGLAALALFVALGGRRARRR